MANLTTPTKPAGATRATTRPDYRELARWDGSLLTIDTGPYLHGDSPTGGAVLVRIRVATGNPAGGGPVWDETYQPMARAPRPDELLDLVRAAFSGNRRELRILLVIELRALDEDEARAAWGDR